ncbi:MBL fold metallo-hydrolase [Halostreptopolyspora alba]|uniref:MBL fold metallo-hydrolase n=1 Tax=Halostreptopolyspora alba TaxID=2487137 RepID=A0A3N0EAH5_9ACTN|nr:MBL fold metallo-hydrolase [Nocardiopsaceae bacterium YIM 96095]
MRDMPSVEDLGNGVWSLPVPIPDNPLGYTLTYLIESAHGPVLVDTGWNSEESWNALTTGLDRAGVSVTDVRGAVLTHFHPDHSGLAARLREASGAWIALHHADAAMLRRVTAQRRTDRREFEVTQLRRAGAPTAEIEAHEVATPPFDTRVSADRELSHGELVDLPDRELRVLWTPGHSPGHICLHLKDSGHLFTGDHILPRITPHVGLFPLDDSDNDPLGRFLDSLGQIHELGATEALPAHERRFRDLAGRTSEIIAHHEERLEQLAAALEGEPATLWEIAPLLEWRRAWKDMRTAARRMAASETAAHLRLLERRGLAVCSTDPNTTDTATPGALRWRSTAGSAAAL